MVTMHTTAACGGEVFEERADKNEKKETASISKLKTCKNGNNHRRKKTNRPKTKTEKTRDKKTKISISDKISR